MVAWTSNKSLSPAIYSAARFVDASLRTRLQLRRSFFWATEEQLRELEQELTFEARKAGVIPPEAVVDGVFTGNWLTDLLDWIIANWDSIFKIIMAIIGLFIAE